MLDRLTGACCTQQTAIRAAKTLKAPPGQPLARFCGCFSCFAQAPPGRVAAGMLQRRALFPRCAARGGGCAAGRGFRWRVAAAGASSALRRAGCCVDAGPAGRCGRFSCFAHAPLIKKSGQKRNHGLLWPALPSGWSVSGTRASAALRAVAAGGRGRKGSFGCVGKVLGMGFGGWVCGACAVRWGFGGMLTPRAAPCSVTGTGAAGCC